MEKSSIIIATLILYNFFLILVGWSTRKKNKTIEDYGFTKKQILNDFDFVYQEYFV